MVAIQCELCQCVINTPAMSPIHLLLHMFFLLHLAQGNQVQCRVRDLHSLKIEVEDSNHLLISWEEVFRDCQDKDIKAVVVKNAKNADSRQKITEGLYRKTASLRLNPCLTHSLSVQLEFIESYNEEHDFPIVQSNEEEYSPLQQVCREKRSGEPVVPESLKSCFEIEWNHTTNLVEVVSGATKGDSLQLEELKLCSQNISNNNNLITAVVMACVVLTTVSSVLAFWLCTKKRRIIWQYSYTDNSTNDEGPVEMCDGYRQVTPDNPYDYLPRQAPMESHEGLHR